MNSRQRRIRREFWLNLAVELLAGNAGLAVCVTAVSLNHTLTVVDTLIFVGIVCGIFTGLITIAAVIDNLNHC